MSLSFLLLLPFFAPTAAPASNAEAIARAVAPPSNTTIGFDEATLRQRAVALAVDGLFSQTELSLELFDGDVLHVLRRGVSSAPGGFVWTGVVMGHEESDVVLSVVGDTLAGRIDFDDRLFQLRYAGEGKHWLQESDPAQYPACGTDSLTLEPVPPQPGPPAASMAGTPRIDVLVAYTPAARAAEGGDAAMLARINLAVSQTNQAYAQSFVDQRIQLVRWGEAVGYVEPQSFVTILDQLTNPSDGKLDEIHLWRDQSGADAVSLLCVNRQFCGAAHVMTALTPAFESQAFSVVNHTCATSIATFAHELGHTCGSTHDPDNAGLPLFPYSFGYRTPDARYRTIMAYAPGSRIKVFSNPAVTFNGYAMGSATANNARSMNETAATVAAFRSDLPDLQVSTLRGGMLGSFDMLRLTPGGIAVLAYSTIGGGPFPTSFGMLELSAPIVPLAVLVADQNGQASYSQIVPTPPGLFNPIWFQSFDLTKMVLSNGVKRLVL